MGEDSNKMGFCEAKMSFSHTNEAGLTGLGVSNRDWKPKDTPALLVPYKRSHQLQLLERGLALLLTLPVPPAHSTGQGAGTGLTGTNPTRTPCLLLCQRDSEATAGHCRGEREQPRSGPAATWAPAPGQPLCPHCSVRTAGDRQVTPADCREQLDSRSSLSPRSQRDGDSQQDSSEEKPWGKPAPGNQGRPGPPAAAAGCDSDVPCRAHALFIRVTTVFPGTQNVRTQPWPGRGLQVPGHAKVTEKLSEPHKPPEPAAAQRTFFISASQAETYWNFCKFCKSWKVRCNCYMANHHFPVRRNSSSSCKGTSSTSAVRNRPHIRAAA